MLLVRIYALFRLTQYKTRQIKTDIRACPTEVRRTSHTIFKGPAGLLTGGITPRAAAIVREDGGGADMLQHRGGAEGTLGLNSGEQRKLEVNRGTHDVCGGEVIAAHGTDADHTFRDLLQEFADLIRHVRPHEGLRGHDLRCLGLTPEFRTVYGQTEVVCEPFWVIGAARSTTAPSRGRRVRIAPRRGRRVRGAPRRGRRVRGAPSRGRRVRGAPSRGRRVLIDPRSAVFSLWRHVNRCLALCGPVQGPGI